MLIFVCIIKLAMESWRIKLEKCRGQAYNGAANMAGHLNSVAAQIKRHELRAFLCIAWLILLTFACKNQVNNQDQ